MVSTRFFLLVFFFQAEDGIRDATVTGVQTCALPIYIAVDNGGSTGITVNGTSGNDSLVGGAGNDTLNRSEERRVGKECRSQWARYDEKKKKNERNEREYSNMTRSE